MKRLPKSAVVDFLQSRLDNSIEPLKGNWLQMHVAAGQEEIFFCQCKPSSASKGHWKHDFWNTLSIARLGEIASRGAMLVLINYVDKVWTVLDGEDLVWLAVFSTRRKSNEGMVCDIVIERTRDGAYVLRPYDRMKTERKKVDVISW